jgi:hypothetical protein
MKIVIGRYREDLSWALPYREHIIIYNKGEQQVDQFSDQRFVPNVGRETHTYYQYIVDHYDCLDNFTIFLQGNPFDHSPNIIHQLNHYLSQQEILQLNFDFLSRTILHTHLSGCPFHIGLPMREVYQKIFGVAREHMTFRFGAGAQFIVSKETILRRPKSFYQNIVSLVDYSVAPIETWTIERFHELIFSHFP